MTHSRATNTNEKRDSVELSENFTLFVGKLYTLVGKLYTFWRSSRKWDKIVPHIYGSRRHGARIGQVAVFTVTDRRASDRL